MEKSTPQPITIVLYLLFDISHPASNISRMKNFVILAAVLLIAACTTITQENGAEIRQVKLDQVTPNSSKADVFNLLGSPSTKSMYGEETWYYITSKIKRRIWKDDKIVSESVIAITFTPEGKIENMEVYDKSGMRQFATSDRVTPTAGRQLTVIEQVLSNVGKFNNDNGATDTFGSRAPNGGARPY